MSALFATSCTETAPWISQIKFTWGLTVFNLRASQRCTLSPSTVLPDPDMNSAAGFCNTESPVVAVTNATPLPQSSSCQKCLRPEGSNVTMGLNFRSDPMLADKLLAISLAGAD